MSLSGTALSRGGQALTLLAGVSVWLSAPHASADLAALSGSDFPRALLGLASVAQLVIGAWVIVVVGLVQLFGSASAVRAFTPRILRSALFASTAGVLAIAPAHADSGIAPPHDRAPASARPHDLTGLPYPDRPQTDRPRPERPKTSGPNGVVTVRLGDTLWAIARRSLPAGASDADTARACGAWYAANRDVIGTDPDLIFPNQRLHPPTKEHS